MMLLLVAKEILRASVPGANASGARTVRHAAALAKGSAGGDAKRKTPVAACCRACVDVTWVVAEDAPSDHSEEVSNPAQIVARLLARREMCADHCEWLIVDA
jgi:hypothetical protein